MTDGSDEALLLGGEPPSGFQQLLGFRLVDWRLDYAVIELALEGRHGNRSGVVHGGVLTTLMDTACGFSASWCLFSGRVRHLVTLSFTVNFIGQARHGTIRAIGRKRGGGNRIVFCAAEVLDGKDNLIAVGGGTFRYRGGSETAEGVPM